MHIIAVQHEGNVGATMVDLMRKHRGTGQTRYRWKKPYGATEASEAKRLKVLEEQRRQLKRLVADQALSVPVVMDTLGETW